MEYKLSEQELKDLMHRSWLKAKKFYSGKTDEYFYDYFEREKKQLPINGVVKSLKDKKAMSFGIWKMKCKDIEYIDRKLVKYKGHLMSYEDLEKEYYKIKHTL